MPAKKKKTVAKKPTVKKVSTPKPKPVKKVAIEITPLEQRVIDNVKQLHDDGYHVCVRCDGRNKMVNPGEDILNYIRLYRALSIIGTKSGCAAKEFEVK